MLASPWLWGYGGSSGAGKGSKGGWLPPMLKKMALLILPNSMSKLGRGLVSISDVKKSYILNIFNVTVLFCTVFLLRGCYSELHNQRSTAFYCKNEKNNRLFILISAYEGGVGHVYSQSRGCGQRKIFRGSAPDPEIFSPQ